MERLIEPMRLYDQKLGHSEEKHQELFSKFHEQLKQVNNKLDVEQCLNEKIVDLREIKATIRERLQATETSLAEARQRNLVLENQEHCHMRKISLLESEAENFRSKVAESMNATTVLCQLESRNHEFQQQMESSRSENSEISKQLQYSREENAKFQEQVHDLQSQLDLARSEAISLLEQKNAQESRASTDCEQLRKQLSEAARVEQQKLHTTFMNQINQLRHQATATESKFEQKNQELDRLRTEIDASHCILAQKAEDIYRIENKRNEEV